MAAIIMSVTALVDFYEKTGGDNWKVKLNWMEHPNYCLWYGITCDSKFNVVAIKIPGNNLIGTIPASLRSLDHLSALILPNNKIASIHPDAFQDKAFCTVDLTKNKLTEIPTCLTTAFGLFGFNKISSVPTGQISNIEMSCNKLTGKVDHTKFLTSDFTCNAVDCQDVLPHGHSCGNLVCGPCDIFQGKPK
ncbi:Leucine-rich repeat protein [Spironucleus salmonicida]|uniref:Leucine-rich repeat protein n=1 Tax=Spironucleus salmonicida TaxID=348837 RepID=V6LU23_9EUKA|nr:Leucine-rich repeat protein [Spironucleus salmonicida]|eukprot:EST47733.1 Leucine-rich repeat-containing protein [Spironucleus salmonicida]